jgi:triacylglycerol lipase
MISRWLRTLLALEAVALAAAAAFLMNGAGPSMIAVAVIGALPVLNLAVTVAIYVILRLYAPASVVGTDFDSPYRWWSAISECLALLGQFMVIAPFERWWMGADTVRPLPAGRLPVLLVHGYLCNRGLWWWLRRGLRADHIEVATLNLEPPLAGIDHFVAQLHRRIEALVAETGAGRVALVTHSMGGLVARAYLQHHGAARVGKLVTIAAPHRGTEVARLGLGRNAREMQPGSIWLRRLNASAAPPVAGAALWSRADEFVVPHDSGRLPGAAEHILPALGHIGLTWSAEVLRLLKEELA